MGVVVITQCRRRAVRVDMEVETLLLHHHRLAVLKVGVRLLQEGIRLLHRLEVLVVGVMLVEWTR